ncbi:MAG: radical SAM/SPASM domain-containing protein [Candidatus Hodarchaeota archaeon]
MTVNPKFFALLLNYHFFNTIPKLPSVIRIEITNKCDLRCIICDRQAMKRKASLMDFGLFKKIVDDAVRMKIPVIGLNRFGEPLLHPQIVDMVRYCKEQGAKHVEFTTNATHLTRAMSSEIMEAGLNEIDVSIDGFTKETYEKIRVGAKYESVMKNVHNLLKLKKEKNSNIKIQINCVVNNINIDELKPFHKYWHRRVDHIWFIPMMQYGDVKDISVVNEKEKRCKCIQLPYMFVVYADGKAGVCCAGDPGGVLKIGDLSKESIYQIWNGETVWRIREIHFAKSFNKLPVCYNCDLIYPYTHWLKYSLKIWKKILFYINDMEVPKGKS